ncbi:MAG: flagellar biosynthesis protein FlhB [Oceanospirillaceae bacterium]|mgnify:FL=1|nr:flagellar biosynthesis protein FlhB [Oceanospirillaceae bacterium]
MSEDSSQEKTEQPTAKKLEKSREDGQVPRSKELSMAIIMVFGAAFLLLTGDSIIDNITEMLIDALTIDRALLMDTQRFPSVLLSRLVQGILAVMPFLLLTLVLALVTPALIGGWLFSTKAIGFKANKLNPLSGLKRMLGTQALMELVKALIKFLLVAGIGYLVVVSQIDHLMALGQMSLGMAMAEGGMILLWAFFYICLSLMVIAGIDVPYQIYSHTEKLKMSIQDIKDEMKEMEGRPEVKAQVRQRQREMAMGRMLDEVPNADVVITNPQHFAVALVYDQAGAGAPVVLAKGQGEMAARIREIADQEHVQMLRMPLLARALYFTSEINEEIPEGLFVAVAQVLAYVYQMNAVIPGTAPPLQPNPEVPSDYRYNEDGDVI